MRLTIKNFQSISETTLDFPVGITAIIGSSNAGKTSILRALSCLLTNSSEAKSHIRRGSKELEVSLELDNRPKITWTRTPKESKYDIKDESYVKVGKTNLLELINLDEFYKDPDLGELVNIQDEWSLLFPFNRTDSQMYKLFESIFAINDSSLVMKKIKEDESIRKKELCNLNSELIRNSNKYDSLSEYLENLDEKLINNYKDKLSDNYNYLSKLELNISKIKNNSKKYDILRKVKRKEFNFSVLENYIKIKTDYKYIMDNEKILNFKIKREEFNFESLENYIKIKTDWDKVSKYLKEYNNLKNIIKNENIKRSELQTELDKVDECPLCGSNTTDCCLYSK